MKLTENKSQIWFKVLTPEGRELEDERKKWPLPDGAKKGEWIFSGCRIGTLLVVNPSEFIQKNNRVFVAELDAQEAIIEIPGLIWVRKTRLVREATGMDLKRFGIHHAFRQVL